METVSFKTPYNQNRPAFVEVNGPVPVIPTKSDPFGTIPSLSRCPALVLNIMLVGVSFEEFKAGIPALVAQLKPFRFAHRDLALRTAPAAVREQFHGDEDLIFGHYIAYGWPVEKAEPIETVPVEAVPDPVFDCPSPSAVPATRWLAQVVAVIERANTRMDDKPSDDPFQPLKIPMVLANKLFLIARQTVKEAGLVEAKADFPLKTRSAPGFKMPACDGPRGPVPVGVPVKAVPVPMPVSHKIVEFNLSQAAKELNVGYKAARRLCLTQGCARYSCGAGDEVIFPSNKSKRKGTNTRMTWKITPADIAAIKLAMRKK